MELQLVNFKQAVALKELGFPQDISQSTSYGEYDESGDFWGLDQYYGDNSYAAPTLELVAKWLREEKGMLISVYCLLTSGYWWNISKDFAYTVKYKDMAEIHSPLNIAVPEGDSFGYETYEDALSAGIDKAIEMLK